MTDSFPSDSIVLGATGLVGSALVRQLLQETPANRVLTLGRRKSGFDDPHLLERIVDFGQPESYREQVQGMILYSALGTTIKSAGSQEVQWQVDYQYQLDVARAARDNGVKTHVLISSSGAHADSRIFYSRMKGKLERAIRELGFPRSVILRPGILSGDRVESRPGEKLALGFLKLLPQALLPAAARPVSVEVVARAARSASRLDWGDFTFEAAEIFQRGR